MSDIEKYNPKKKKTLITTESFIERASVIHGNRYVYDETTFTNVSGKVKMRCPKHGVFVVRAGGHLYLKQGCRQCYIERKIVPLETHLEHFRLKHGDFYDYSEVRFLGDSHAKVPVICPIHGRFLISPQKHKTGTGCYHCGLKKSADIRRDSRQEFIDKANVIHGGKYTYIETVYVDSQTKVSITCAKHGKFTMTPNSHLSGQGCKRCSHESLSLKFRFTNDEYLQRVKEVHGDKYDYSKVVYTGSSKKIIVGCPKHGDFTITARSHMLGNGCRVCSSSKGELFILKVLQSNGIKFLREFRLPEFPASLHRYDFWLPEHNLLIEFHGGQHYFPIEYFGGEEEFAKTKERDLHKKWMARKTKRNIAYFNYKHIRHPKMFEKKLLKLIDKFSPDHRSIDVPATTPV